MGKVNGSCTDETPITDYYSWNNTSPFCAHDFPVDGVNYTAKYTALKFKIMERALRSQNRTILYSLCEWGRSILLMIRRDAADKVCAGVDQVWTWGNATGSSWRTTNDIGFGEGKLGFQIVLLAQELISTSFMEPHLRDLECQQFPARLDRLLGPW